MHPRTLPDLPSVPFAPLSRKKWFTGMEKKPRVEIVDDNPPSFVGGELSIDDFEKLSMSDFTPRSGAAGSMRTKSVTGDGRSVKGEDWRDIERSEVMSKMTPRTNVTRPSSPGTGLATTSPGQTTPGGDTSLSGKGSKVYQGKRRGSQTSRSGSYTRRSKASEFSKAYSSAMSVNEEDDQGEVKLSKQQELFLLYQELREDGELGFWEIGSEVGYINYILFWRRGMRLKRMHHVIIEYEQKVKDYHERLRAEIAKEMGQDERELMAFVREQDAIRRKYNLRLKTQRLVAHKMERSLLKYEKKAALVQYYCDHLHDWAIEKHDQKVAQKRADEEEAERRRLKAEADRKEATRLRRVRREMEILEEDRQVTQGTLSLMRRAGKMEPVNVADLGHVLPPVKGRIDSEVVDLFLKDSVDFHEFKKNGRFVVPNDEEKEGGGGGSDHFNPFNLDLTSNSSKVVVLQCHGIGERGAHCLAADFIRGACPFLEVLSLAHCEINPRGLSKVLHGLRIGKLRSVGALDLRGNHLTPRALEYLREALSAGVFEALTAIDLRENELGDEGCIALSRMFIAGVFERIEDLHVQQNNVTDRGFLSLAKLLVHLWPQKAPRLQRIGLEGNRISAEAKRSIDPLPAFFSF